jgi:hypothetical protein
VSNEVATSRWTTAKNTDGRGTQAMWIGCHDDSGVTTDGRGRQRSPCHGDGRRV